MEDYYKILGLSQNASLDEIRRAYHELAKKNHPDHNSGNAYAEEKFKKIKEAYEILSDPIERAKYDFAFNGERNKQNQSWASENRASQNYSRQNYQYHQNQQYQRAQQNQWNQQKSYTASAAKSSYTASANNRSERIEPRKSHAKKIFKIFSIIILFAGCFCFYHFYYANDDGLAGSYTLDSMTSEGKTKTAEQYARIAKINKKMGMWEGDDKFGSLVLKKSGTGTMTFEGESREVMWNSEKIAVPEEDETYTYTLEENELTVFVSDASTLVFLRKKKKLWLPLSSANPRQRARCRM